MADLATFVPTRQRADRPGRDLLDGALAPRPSTAPMATEDAATILLRFDNGARGSVAISQISAGRKNSLQWEIDGSDGAVAWDSEQPDQLWLGHRDRPNEILLRNPALMGPPGGPRRRCRAATSRASATRSAPSSGPSTPTSRPGGPPTARRTRPSPTATTRCSSTTRSPRARGRPLGRRRSRASRDPAPASRDVGRRHRRSRSMRLGLLTAPFPETPLDGGRRLDRRERLREHRDRLLAAVDRPDPALRRHRATSTSRTCRRPGARRSSTRSRPRASPSPASATTRTRSTPIPAHRDDGHRPPEARDRPPPRRMDVPLVNTFMGGDGAKTQDENWEEALRVWPDIVALRAGPRAEDHDRELPDALQLRRVAGRPQPRDDAADLAPDPRAVGRHDRAQLRPVAPDPPDDRHPAVHPRVRAAHPPRPGQGPDDRPRRAVRARRLLGRHRLAGPAAARPRRRRLGRPVRGALPRRLRRRHHHRARGSRLREAPTSWSSAASCSPATSSGRTSSDPVHHPREPGRRRRAFAHPRRDAYPERARRVESTNAVHSAMVPPDPAPRR